MTVFCLDDRLLRGRHASGPRTQFMLECLRDLDASLRARWRRCAALTLTFLRSASELRGRRLYEAPLKVPSGHWPTKPTLSGGLGSRGVPASMKLSVSTIRRPSAAVEPSGHRNEINQRAEATSSVKPFAAAATDGTASNASAASRQTRYLQAVKVGGRIGLTAAADHA